MPDEVVLLAVTGRGVHRAGAGGELDVRAGDDDALDALVDRAARTCSPASSLPLTRGPSDLVVASSQPAASATALDELLGHDEHALADA